MFDVSPLSAALAVCQGALDVLGGGLASLVEDNGRVSTAALDRHQLAAFRYAHLAARLSAAESLCVVAADARAPGALDRLAGLLLGETVAELWGLCTAQPGDFGVDRAAATGAFGPRPDESVPALTGSLIAPERYDEAARLVASDGLPSDAGLSAEHRLVRQTFRRFVETEVAPMAMALHRENRLVPDRLIEGLRDLGCFALSVPAVYGGVNERPDLVGMVVVTEELSRGSLAGAGSLMTRPEILVRALLAGGTEEQRRRWLPSIATGEKMVAISVTEPDAGSDVAAIRLAARRVDGGWALNGAKLWCTFAGRAELIMVLARTDPDPAVGHRGLSAFVVEKPAADGESFEHRQPGGGRLVGRAIPTIGYRGMHSFELHFDNYVVPAENVIGGDPGLGRGFYLQMEGFGAGRLQTAGRAVGVMEAAFEEALRYAGDRRVFGRPLFDFSLTRFKLARMAMLITAGRQLAYRSARELESGSTRGQTTAAMAKLLAATAAEWVAREAMQLYGGIGYSEETPVARHFVDARVLSIFEGTEEVLALRVIARGLLDERLKRRA